VDLLGRFAGGQFLAIPELNRIALAAQYRLKHLEEDKAVEDKPGLKKLSHIRFRRKSSRPEHKAVDVNTQASRLRYIADYLSFLSDSIASNLPKNQREAFIAERERSLRFFQASMPQVSRRVRLNARVGLDEDETNRLLSIVDPNSSANPWDREFVRKRNWLIVVLLLASGMRRGELLGLQIGDIHPNQPKIRIIRRADAEEDARRIQPNTKTNEREIELSPAIMRALWSFLNNERHAITAARRIPQVIVSDEGAAFSHASIDKLFAQLRAACPGLPMRLTSHVMRHTWNDRFSEQAEALGLSDTVEQKARNLQQGWSDNSTIASTYTRRYTARKGREISLKLQERLDEKFK
jgi:integrase